MYLTNTPDAVFKDLAPDGSRYQPIKSQIRLLLNEIISGVDSEYNPNAASLERKLFTSAGNYVVDAADFDKMHVARTTGDVAWNLSGISFYRPYWFAADYNSGVVILDVGPGYYWRNTTPRDGSIDLKSAIRLRPGDVAQIYRITTNEYWVIAGYSRPSYVMLNSGGDGYIERGPNGIYSGTWRRVLAPGATTLTFSTAYSGAPSFTGAATRFTGFAPLGTSVLTAAPIVRQSGTGAGTITLVNDGAANIEGFVNFWGLTE